MSSDRLRTQLTLEGFILISSGSTLAQIHERDLRTYTLTAGNVAVLESSLKLDAIDFYYKGLHSFFEGIISVDRKWFSWATVKIYYSLFYFLRSTLCAKNVAFIRKERDAFYFKNAVGNSPIKVNGLFKSDHRAAIFLSQTFFSATDFLQSNQIDGKNPYEWVMVNRENVNYKYRTFYEPDIPLFWDTISSSLDTDGLDYWLNTYMNDTIYCFLDDHAMLALPLQRLILTYRDLVNENILPVLANTKLHHLEEMIRNFPILNRLRTFIR